VTVVGLHAGTTYHYRIVASSNLGTAYGKDQTFTTKTVDVAGELAKMPVTEPFDGSEASLQRFATEWSTLSWATGETPKGVDTTTGWQPIDEPTKVDGAYRNSSLSDEGMGLAAAATLAEEPKGSLRGFRLWLDMPTPSGTKAGYELRFNTTLTNGVYQVQLHKWVEGKSTELASKASYAFAKGSSLAIVDEGATVSAWTNTGSGFQQLLSAADSTFEGGMAGVSGSGSSTRLTNFKAGALG
jgi:hypothetical protein